jgi:hypothetical protein
MVAMATSGSIGLDYTSRQNIFRYLLKFGGILIVFTLLNPNVTTKLPCHSAMLREEGLNSQTRFVIKKVPDCFLITVYSVK